MARRAEYNYTGSVLWPAFSMETLSDSKSVLCIFYVLRITSVTQLINRIYGAHPVCMMSPYSVKLRG